MFNVLGKGLICKEPELRYTVNSVPVCNATAVNKETYNGEEKSHFTNLVIWGDLAEDFSKEVKKGTIIEITSGFLKHPVSEYNGKKIYKTEVIVLDWDIVKVLEDKPIPVEPPKEMTAKEKREARKTGNK